MRYEFAYTTPTPAPTEADPNAINQVPTVFALDGISPDVAKGIRFGLRRVQQLGLIANVDVGFITETRTAVTTDPGSP
jgi:hypothetical protein